MDYWRLEVRLINPKGEEAKVWRRKLEQIDANKAYEDLIAGLKQKYPNTQP